MFRLQKNVPEVYVDESRDFQLFCRLYDCINAGVKFDIDTMINIFDPMKCNDRLLDLVCTKIGFFPKRDIDTLTLRYIIAAFPYIMRYKGSKKGIAGAVSTILKAANTYANFSIQVDNSTHSIEILIEDEFNELALNEVLEYIIPCGYMYSASVASTVSGATQLDVVNVVNLYQLPTSATSQVTNYGLYWAAEKDGGDLVSNILPSYEVESVELSSDTYSLPERNETTETYTDIMGVEHSYVVTRLTYYQQLVDPSDGETKQYKKVLKIKVPVDDVTQYRNTIGTSQVITWAPSGTDLQDSSYSDDLTYTVGSTEVNDEIDTLDSNFTVFDSITDDTNTESTSEFILTGDTYPQSDKTYYSYVASTGKYSEISDFDYTLVDQESIDYNSSAQYFTLVNNEYIAANISEFDSDTTYYVLTFKSEISYYEKLES